MPAATDVLVVGAGPAGLGLAALLRQLEIEATVVDARGVGASFRSWPTGTRLLTPSFPSNQFGLPDLNAITVDTAPSLNLATEHPTGPQYANYLDFVAELYDLDVQTGVQVADVAPAGDGLLHVQTIDGSARPARNVVWAAGEFHHPAIGRLAGEELGVHSSRVGDWSAVEGDHVVVVGGYESGIDTACHLVALGRRVTVLDSDGVWRIVDGDPSRTLSPVTLERLREAQATGRLDLVSDVTAKGLEPDGSGVAVRTADGRSWRSDGPPVLATGFDSSLRTVAHRFAWDDTGRVVVSEAHDESTVLPGLFLCGPMLRHRKAIFCFIYKFRQRFAVVAAGIAQRLGVDASPLEVLREHGMYLDDLSCCDTACAC